MWSLTDSLHVDLFTESLAVPLNRPRHHGGVRALVARPPWTCLSSSPSHPIPSPRDAGGSPHPCLDTLAYLWGFLGGASGEEPAGQCRRPKRCGFSPWVGKISWRRKWPNHSSILASEIPWREEPGGPQSMGSQRVRPGRSDWAQQAFTRSEPWKPAWGCLSRECWVLKAQRAVWALDEPAALASRMHPPEVGARAEEAQSEQSSGWPSDSSLGIARELSGNAETQAPSQTPGIRICILAVQVIHMHVTVWETLLWGPECLIPSLQRWVWGRRTAWDWAAGGVPVSESTLLGSAYSLVVNMCQSKVEKNVPFQYLRLTGSWIKRFIVSNPRKRIPSPRQSNERKGRDNTSLRIKLEGGLKTFLFPISYLDSMPMSWRGFPWPKLIVF